MKVVIRYFKYLTATIMLSWPNFLFTVSLFQEIGNWTLFAHIWSWWRHSGGQIFKISENWFYFWILHPKLTLDGKFCHFCLIRREDRQMSLFCPSPGIMTSRRGPKSSIFATFFKNLIPFSNFSVFFSIKIHVFIKSDKINARKSNLCISNLVWNI